jgi:hypothetical protein
MRHRARPAEAGREHYFRRLLPRFVIRMGVGVAAGYTLVLAAVGSAVLPHYGVKQMQSDAWVTLSLRMLPMLITVMLLGGYRKRRMKRRIDASHKSQSSDQLDDEVSKYLQRRAGSAPQLKSMQINVFVAAITRPSSLRKRVTEYYEPERRTVRQRVAVEIQIPPEIFPETDSAGSLTGAEEVKSTSTVFMPVVLPLKGELNDNFVIRDANGALVSALSYPEYLQLAARLLRMLFLRAFNCRGTGFSELGDLRERVEAAELSALRSIMKRGRQTPRDIGSVVDDIMDLKAIHPDADISALLCIASIIQRLSNRYAIVAVIGVGSDGRIVLQYERIVVPDLSLNDRVRVSVSRRGSAATGRSPQSAGTVVGEDSEGRPLRIDMVNGLWAQGPGAESFAVALATTASDRGIRVIMTREDHDDLLKSLGLGTARPLDRMDIRSNDDEAQRAIEALITLSDPPNQGINHDPEHNELSALWVFSADHVDILHPDLSVRAKSTGIGLLVYGGKSSGSAGVDSVFVVDQHGRVLETSLPGMEAGTVLTFNPLTYRAQLSQGIFATGWLLVLGRWFGQKIRSLRRSLRLLLGTRPVTVRVPIENASTSDSYHLIVTCPEGLYLRHNSLVNRQGVKIDEYLERKNLEHGRKRATNPQSKDIRRYIPPYYRVRRRLGQPHAHFYSRYFPEPDVWEDLPEFKLSFFEIPPGSIFRAAVASVSSAVLIWVVGFVVSRNPHSLNLQSDAPAILLAFPAVIAGWLGIDAPRDRLLEGTLTARLLLIGAALSALAASTLFFFYRASPPILTGSQKFLLSYDYKISFLGITETSWGILSSISIVNAVCAVYLWLMRTYEFSVFSSRSVHDRATDPFGPVREGAKSRDEGQPDTTRDPSLPRT